LPEIVEHGRSWFLVDDLQEATLAVRRAGTLDRRQVRHAVLRRFSVDRMVDDYERVYRDLVVAREPKLVEVVPPSAARGLASRERTDTSARTGTASLEGAG
jgi:hypothetical protein